jgi:hypothetical protein
VTLGCLAAISVSAIMPTRAFGATVCPSSTVSSPGYREYLPGCSAFELVNPAYDGGGLLGSPTKGQLPPMSQNGEHVLALAFSGFAGTEELGQVGLQFGALYEFSRAATGWIAESLEPPAGEFPRSGFLFASANFEKSLWFVAPAPERGRELPIPPPNGVLDYNGLELAVRERTAGGGVRFAPVGPISAPGRIPNIEKAAVRGASASLSHILIDVPTVDHEAWPGDETNVGSQSLYEYEYPGASGGEAEPVLVGVKNVGSVAKAAAKEGKAHVNEAAELISRCGTVAGGKMTQSELERGSLANAMSASGETVFFTALACGASPAVNELYARIDGKETVDISEPSRSDCAGCDERELRPAEFAGASEDGSKVFFYSEQELLPGASGDNLYEYDLDAANAQNSLTLVAPDVEEVAAISLDGSRVYFDSSSVLTASANGNGETAARGAQNLYVYDTGTGSLAFVAQEANRQLVTVEETQLSRERYGVDISQEGNFAVFGSRLHIAGTDDTSTVPQIFEYDATTGTISRVSVGALSPSVCEATRAVERRYACDGNTTDESDTPEVAQAEVRERGITYTPTAPTTSLTVDDEGAVVFQSRLALTPAAVQGGRNVYEYRYGEVYLVSPGDEPVEYERLRGESRVLGISEDGGNVFFETTIQLVPQDTNTEDNWYDAREDGGFPGPAGQVGCEGEGCQGAPGTQPALGGTPKSAGIAGVAGGALATSTPPPAPVGSPQLTAGKLAKALKACKKDKNRERRTRCERQAHRTYGAAARVDAKKKADK